MIETDGQASQDVLASRRRAAVGLHFSSLPAPLGIGDIADAAAEFLHDLTAMGISVWQVLPTGPTAYGDSPYQPLSAFAGNEMLIGLEPLLRAGVLHDDEVAPLRKLPRDKVDYGALIPIKSELLARAAARFNDVADQDVKLDYQRFVQRHGQTWLDDYALFRILKTLHGERAWPQWAPEYARRDPDALRAVAQEHAGRLEQVRIVQYLFDRQWRVLRQRASEQGIALFGDMPIYIALDSSDTWARRELLLLDENGVPESVAGVPPDYFSADGQLWGNPLYDWDHHRDSGFAWWIERMRHAARMFDMVRIDHFRGFVGYWAVPYGESTARNGQWREGPGDALFEAMQQALGYLPIVAEDLGVITPEVDALRERHHIPGMKVLQFELGDPAFDPMHLDERCVCYTGTHDNDTVTGWFLQQGYDIRDAEEIRRTTDNVLRLTGASRQAAPLELVRMALASPAMLCVIPMQDLLGLGSEARMNIPGTTLNNWRWRLTSEQMGGDFRESIRALVEAAQR